MEPCKTGVMSAMMSGSESAGDVAFGSIASILPCLRDVRFAGNSRKADTSDEFGSMQELAKPYKSTTT